MAELLQACAGVLDVYAGAAARDRFGRASAAWLSVMAFRDAVSSVDSVRQRHALKVKASAGQGNWASIPWVAVMHSALTESTRHGVYAAYLFRADMSGVYLTLMQGVAEPIRRHGAIGGLVELRETASKIRGRLGELVADGFLLEEAVDLCSRTMSAKRYADGIIAHRFYDAGELPDDATFVRDLDSVLRAYERLFA
jgi:5-methylcytosine-specific restriction protein B